MHSILLLMLEALLLFSASVLAFEPLQGQFLARDACPAVQSINKGSNPGSVRLTAGQRYAVSGRNAPGGRYLQVQVSGVQPELRWVDESCGTLAGGGQAEEAAPLAARYLLAASWQPAFCETRSNKTECRSQSAVSPDATHFSLHGLWPQPENKAYCGVPDRDRASDKRGAWERLPEPRIGESTRRRLAIAMPGVASYLERHEYSKHGSCFPGSADDYFRTAVGLLDQINGSRLQAAMAAYLGREVRADALRQAFEQSFGPGTGKALSIHCVGDIGTRRTLISELRVSLQGALTDTSRLRDVLDLSAGGRDDCEQGIVDRAGLD